MMHPTRVPLEVLLENLGDGEAVALEQRRYRSGGRWCGAARRWLVEEEETPLGCKVFPENHQLTDGPLPPEHADVDREDLLGCWD